jgi:hypothetical protein
MLQLREAQQQEAIAYQQTVLRAWHEIDDQLTPTTPANAAATASPKPCGRTRSPCAPQQQYVEGVVDFVNVLTVQGALLATQEQWVEFDGCVVGDGRVVQGVGWGMGVGVSGGGDGAALRLRLREQIGEFDWPLYGYCTVEDSQVEAGYGCSACEIFDFDLPVGKGRDDFKFATHCPDIVAQRADVHIGTALHFRDGRLVDVQHFSQRGLAQGLGLSQFVKRHFLDVLLVDRSASARASGVMRASRSANFLAIVATLLRNVSRCSSYSRSASGTLSSYQRS